jgi:hypothetical protein
MAYQGENRVLQEGDEGLFADPGGELCMVMGIWMEVEAKHMGEPAKMLRAHIEQRNLPLKPPYSAFLSNTRGI